MKNKVYHYIYISAFLLSNSAAPNLAQSLSNFPLGSKAPAMTFSLKSGKPEMLDTYLKQKRIVLLFIPTEFENEASAYLLHLQKSTKALQNRDLQIIAIVAETSELLQKDCGACIEVVTQPDHATTASTQNGEASPRFILIGKDRTVKLNEKHFVEDKALFALVDSMPMRKAEMKKQRDLRE